MKAYLVTVRIECPDVTDADTVLQERLAHDEDYGFPYTLEWYGMIEVKPS